MSRAWGEGKLDQSARSKMAVLNDAGKNDCCTPSACVKLRLSWSLSKQWVLFEVYPPQLELSIVLNITFSPVLFFVKLFGFAVGVAC